MKLHGFGLARWVVAGAVGPAVLAFGFGSQLSDIGKSPFESCRLLQSIGIPSGVETLSKYSFYTCYRLSPVVFDFRSGLSSIESSPFWLCHELKSICLPVGLERVASLSLKL
jgi:hypothetical protein